METTNVGISGMLLKNFVALFAAFVPARAQKQAKDWPFDVTTISAPDGSVTANFVSVGATLMSLWVKDREGKPQDIVIGYDDPTRLLTDPDHPVFNPIVGRYANRIKNGTFSIPITKTAQPPGPGVYQIPTNDHNGQVTLHGGLLGWDRRNWTLVAKSPTSVTYKHVDTADEGFPGTVTAYATHTVSKGGILNTKVYATASEKTPIMLTQHIYWNLDAYQKNSTNVLNHKLKIASSKVVKLDGNSIPTGEFIDVNKDTIFDFRNTRSIGDRWSETVNLCGPPCQGYDHCYIYDGDVSKKPGTTFWSDLTGIKVDITTNQPAVQLYTAYWLNTPRKAAHGGPSLKYGPWGAVAIEQEGYVDAINTPEWGVDQIYHPGRNYVWDSTYKFSTIP